MSDTTEPVGNAFDAYSSPTSEEINSSSINRTEAINSLSSKMAGEQKDRIQGIIDFLSKIKGLSSVNDSKLNSILESSLDNLKNIGTNLVSDLKDAAFIYAMNLLESTLDKIFSEVFIPDIVFLQTVKGLYKVGADPNYNSQYLRKSAYTRDWVETYKWLDEEFNFKQSFYNNQSKNELLLAAGAGCHKIVYYILPFYYDEYLTLKTKTDNMNDNDSEKPNLIRERDKINIYIINSIKILIINSYSNFNVNILKNFIEKFNIYPKYMGDNDDYFNQAAYITASDIDVLAPLFIRHESNRTQQITADMITEAEFNSGTSEYSNKYKSKYNIINNQQNGFLGNSVDTINETWGAEVVTDIKFITPKNMNVKYLYIYLANESKFNQNVLIHKALYDRLSLPIMDTNISALDQALGAVMDGSLVSLGTSIVKNIRSAIYEYQLKVDKLLYDPRNEEAFGIDLRPTLNLPELATDDRYYGNIDELDKNIFQYLHDVFRRVSYDDLSLFLIELFELINTFKVNVNPTNTILIKKIEKFVKWLYGSTIYDDPGYELIIKAKERYMLTSITSIFFCLIIGKLLKNCEFDSNLEDDNDFMNLLYGLYPNKLNILTDNAINNIISGMGESQLASILITSFIEKTNKYIKDPSLLTQFNEFLKTIYSDNCFDFDYNLNKYIYLIDFEDKKSLLTTLMNKFTFYLLNNTFIDENQYLDIKNSLIRLIRLVLDVYYLTIDDLLEDKNKNDNPDIDINDRNLANQISDVTLNDISVLFDTNLNGNYEDNDLDEDWP